VVVALGGLLVAEAAVAQAPQPLTPRGAPSPAPQAPPVQQRQAPQPTEAAPGTLLPQRIEAAPLGTIDPDAAGVLTREQGGFGQDMWQGTRRGIVEEMLPELPVRTASPALRSLMRRLLLSTANPPASEPKAEKSESLIGLRVEQLAAMGDTNAVEQLLKVAPARSTDAALARSEVDTLLLENDTARACPLIAGQAGVSDAMYWRKAYVFCLALAGEHDKAALGAQLARERGDPDSTFQDLLMTLIGWGKPKIDKMPNAQPLHFAMARAAKVPLPADVLSANHPAILRTVATNPSLGNELRVEAAERAEAVGVLDTRVLRDLYSSINFTKDQLEKPLSAAQSDRSPTSRALLYRRATHESVPIAVAQVVQQALTLAREGGRYQSQARVYRDIIGSLVPSRDLVWFAPEASRALLAAGNAQGAETWYEILRASAVTDERAAAVRDRLTPLARLAGAVPDSDWKPAAAAAWLAASGTKEDGTAVPVNELRMRAAIMFNLLEAMGDIVSDAEWEKILSAPPIGSAVMPNPTLWRQANTAAVSGRVGETVLLNAVLVGQGELGLIDSTVLRIAIENLRGVGLVQEARALAVEAAISAGL
jgi:hypothetical protein